MARNVTKQVLEKALVGLNKPARQKEEKEFNEEDLYRIPYRKWSKAQNRYYRDIIKKEKISQWDIMALINKTDFYKEAWSVYYKKYNKERSAADPVYKLSKAIRSSITGCFKRKGYIKYKKTEKILGCSFEFFRGYIQSKMKSWMNWENYGKYNGQFGCGWDLDHIIPISTAKTEEEVIRLNHYTNFQPLCSYINRCKKRNY